MRRTRLGDVRRLVDRDGALIVDLGSDQPPATCASTRRDHATQCIRQRAGRDRQLRSVAGDDAGQVDRSSVRETVGDGQARTANRTVALYSERCARRVSERAGERAAAGVQKSPLVGERHIHCGIGQHQ